MSSSLKAMDLHYTLHLSSIVAKYICDHPWIYQPFTTFIQIEIFILLESTFSAD